jgi:uncharacterized paraquat-inducible protein A
MSVRLALVAIVTVATFTAMPSTRVLAAATTTKPTTAPADTYACSMCPTVKSDKPGKCSKCGMDLTKQAPEQGTKHNHKH